MTYLADLSHLWRSRKFRLLTWVRVLSQAGDGAFQVGIATAFFFDPTSASTPRDIAAGFAVLLAPFTLVGPVRRADDRQVAPPAHRARRQPRPARARGRDRRLDRRSTPPSRCCTFSPSSTLSINRFLLAALTAGIPQVVEDRDLLTANAIMPTMGTIAAAIGAAVGGVVTVFVPGVSDNRLALLALGAAAFAFGTSSWSATALGKRALGPVATIDGKELAAEAIHLLTELRAGYRHLRERVTPFYALGSWPRRGSSTG